MTIASASFIISFLLIAVIAWAAVMSHGRLWRKVAALISLVLLIPVGYFTVYELMGLPKPAHSSIFVDFTENHRVLGYDIHEDKAIFLWFEMPGGAKPRVFSFPYDTETVARLQDAEDDARATASELFARLANADNEVRMRLEFTSDHEFNSNLPEKPDPEDEDVMFFDPDAAEDEEPFEPDSGYGQP